MKNTDIKIEPVEYKTRGEVKKQADIMLAELSNINDRIVKGEFNLMPTERMLCREYLEFTLKYAPALKERLCY